ncbi:MAG TPA: CHAD domain-containing protein [Terriglobia bacterium]|nr:CHAD domain-containing protein [Terriglobia bacterium]
MKRGAELLSSFDRSWKEFSKNWQKARAKGSEKAIHGLRVNTRRCIAVLDLAQALSRRDGIPKLQHRFKKVLKGMGALRDIQVQLEKVSGIPETPLIAEFKERLKSREQRELKRLHDQLTRDTKNRLSKNIKRLLSELSDAEESFTNSRVQRAVERVLISRRNQFQKAERRFRRLVPSDEEALHEMRIALKKMRYVVEAALPLLGESAKERARQMRALQQLMGESRDLEMLRAELEKWAGKKGKKIAIVPALQDLQEKREALIKKILELPSPDFKDLIPSRTAKLVAETTLAVRVAMDARSDRVEYPALRPGK